MTGSPKRRRAGQAWGRSRSGLVAVPSWWKSRCKMQRTAEAAGRTSGRAWAALMFAVPELEEARLLWEGAADVWRHQGRRAQRQAVEVEGPLTRQRGLAWAAGYLMRLEQPSGQAATALLPAGLEGMADGRRVWLWS